MTLLMSGAVRGLSCLFRSPFGDGAGGGHAAERQIVVAPMIEDPGGKLIGVAIRPLLI